MPADGHDGGDKAPVQVKEFEIEGHEKEPFLLTEQLEDPDSTREYIQKASRAARIHDAIRSIWLANNSHLLRVETFDHVTHFETDSVAFRMLLSKYLENAGIAVYSDRNKYTDGNYLIITARIANINYQISK